MLQASTTSVNPQKHAFLPVFLKAALETDGAASRLYADVMANALAKQSMGIPPHQYHIQCRVERAKQLLRQGELAIAEIAQTVGFASQGHLNYHFKRLTGLTPKGFMQP
ncbi:MAG: helix-turn-helix transcriptional regulator [Cyanothece sp. SIO1E1]|nr:helix-turn-helix transcriptional regulator [Cyanothece sp. SIO1E1]